MKSKFREIRVVSILFVIILSPMLPYGLIYGTTLNLTDRIGWSIFFGALVIVTLIFIWDLFLNRLVKIELQGGNLKFKNIITRNEKQIKISEIKETKYTRWRGTLDFVTSKEKIRVVPENYRNLNEFIDRVKEMGEVGK